MKRYYERRLWQGAQGIDVLHNYALNGKITGALAALREIPGCIPVLHGPIGCAFHYRRSTRTPAPVYEALSTRLDDSDVVFGGEEKLIDVLERAAAEHILREMEEA